MKENHKLSLLWKGFRSLFTVLVVLLPIVFTACGQDDMPEFPSGAGDFTTQADSASISGELFLPGGDGPFPVVVIVAGSGSEAKERAYGFNNLFLSQGIAIYHYDKRGIGQSTGSYPIETVENPQDFLKARRDDVLGVLDLLVAHRDIDNNRIGLLGASQGAWVNSLVVEQNTEVDFMIMSVGGVAPTRIEHLYDQLTEDPSVTIQDALMELENYQGDLGFDPLPIIRQMSMPVAWLYGGMDRSHPTYYDIPVLESLNKPNFSILLFDNSDHDLKDVNTGQIELTVFPSIFSWFDQNVR